MRGWIIPLATIVAAVAGSAGCASDSHPPQSPADAQKQRFAETMAFRDYHRPQDTDLSQFFGLNAIHPFHDYSSGDPTRQRDALKYMDGRLDLVDELGAAGCRIDMWWSVVEPTRGQFDLAFPDGVINGIVAHGIEPYPILCYNAQWDDGKAPVTAESRAAFARYAYKMASRYKGKVRYWEVWNEPNIRPFWMPTPDAEDYAKLLQEASSRIKEADPRAKVVAMVTAGADEEFMESVYRAGGADIDAIAFHRYSAKATESELEDEIRKVRRVMQRYTDGSKPLFISESGLSTGASTVISPSTSEEQARWMLKQQFISIAEGVERFYYFKMVDDLDEYGAPDHWGLMDKDGIRKPSWRAYETALAKLKGAKFLGRAYRTSADAARPDGVEFQIYQPKEPAGAFAVAWVRDDGADCVARFRSAAPVRILDMNGENVPEVAPDAEGIVAITLSKDPVYIEGLTNEAVALTATRFEPDILHVIPGRPMGLQFVVRNAGDEPITVDLSSIELPPAYRGLTLKFAQTSVTAAPRSEKHIPVIAAIAPDAKPFRVAWLRSNHNSEYSYELSVHRDEPFEEEIHATVEGGRPLIAATVFMIPGGEIPSDFTIQPVRRGDAPFTRSVSREMGFASLPSSMETKFQPVIEEGENGFAVVLTGAGNLSVTKYLRVAGQRFSDSAPTIEGDLDEWLVIPPIYLLPEDNQSVPLRGVRTIAAADLSAEIKTMWTTNALFIAADVTDSTPLKNPERGTQLWKGDSMELYLGFPGPTRAKQYSSGYFQIGVSPGDDGKDPFAWNWQPLKKGDEVRASADGERIATAKVASKRTDHGYAIELMIPLAELGQSIKPGQVMAFDCHLNGWDGVKPGGSDTTLIWNGGATNWKDPSHWGAAVIGHWER
ncbi:hypothetical protein BH09SUM1_BH09SUM1_21920 [soil metagenome]